MALDTEGYLIHRWLYLGQIDVLKAENYERRQEIAELRPVVETVHKTEEKLKLTEEELLRTQVECHELASELKKRDAMIQELMLVKTELEADKEKLEQELNIEKEKPQGGPMTGG